VLICASCGQDNPVGASFCNSCGATLAKTTRAREVRKIVTILFCDVTGSTELGERTDPEALRALLARYFERMKAIVEAHGGAVEKFIGDAVMAVFGVPAAHEDDALRACRAAVEMRDALPELGIAGRIGVNTGEVVTGTEERLATGDAVNVAARLEQAADPGEVLLGERTLALVHEAVVAEPTESLTLKGKSAPVRAFRLVSVLDAPERSHASRFVGRERELRSIAEVWERVQAEGRCELVTVVGDAGVGKSRLVAEALHALEAPVARGRCLPYGDGITYWPVVEVVKQLAVLPSDPAAAAAIRSLLGESDVGTSGDEIAWAFRKLLEEQAPLVVVFDDVQWGEDTFLDLVESTALLTSGFPLLLLCMARHELVERRPGWPGMLRLEPLPPEQANTLIGDGVSGELRERIARAAAGNPLFISEMLAMAAEDADVDVPPTLKALLAARLDQLDEAERRVLERGSVEGEIFHRGGVQALTPEETQVTTRLAALVRRRLVRPDRAQIAGDDGYRFRHVLIRDAAYDALPKAVRADLHVRFAHWLDEHGRDLVERDEIVGYHLEQAARYTAELGSPDTEIADRAAARLATAGRRALDRQDYRAGAMLLTRAAELVRPHGTDVTLELESAWASFAAVSLRAAVERAQAVTERAEAAGDHPGAMLARAMGLVMRNFAGEPDTTDEVIALCRAVLPLEEERGDPPRLALLWLMLSAAAFPAHNDDAVEASLQALHYQRLAGYSRVDVILNSALINGPRPADEAIRMIDEQAVWRPPGSQDLPRAVLVAMLGQFEEAWPLAEARSAHLREVTGEKSLAAHEFLALIADIEGNRERACRYRAEMIEATADAAVAAAVARSYIARDLCYLGRFDEAERLLEEARAVPPRGSGVRVLAASAEALLLAQRGKLEQAEALARTAVATAEKSTDFVWWHALTHEDLATVLERTARTDEAREALGRSLAIWERKGCLPCAQRIRDRIASLASPQV
jgi:class 3 adenylate cyclase/tetratricopeptide (TPR) repeat protein